MVLMLMEQTDTPTEVGKLSRFLNSIRILAWDVRLKTVLYTALKFCRAALLSLLILSLAYAMRQIGYLTSRVTVLEDSSARQDNPAAAVITEKPEDTVYVPRSAEMSPPIKTADTKVSVAIGPLVQPVDGGHMIRAFGWALDKDTGEWSFSNKIIINLPVNSRIKASQDGKVTSLSAETDGRMTVKLDHGNNRFTIYDGLAKTVVESGDTVGRGQTIAYSDRLGYRIIVDLANRNPIDEINWSGIQ